MEPLDTFLPCLALAPKDQDVFSRELNMLSKKHATFGGTWHCETVLLSLFLLSHDSKDYDDVPRELRIDANKLFPYLVAVSKQCCPVCTTLLRVVCEELNWKGIAVIGNVLPH